MNESLRAHGGVESDWKWFGIVSTSCAQAKDRIGIGFANPIATPGLSRLQSAWCRLVHGYWFGFVYCALGLARNIRNLNIYSNSFS